MNKISRICRSWSNYSRESFIRPNEIDYIDVYIGDKYIDTTRDLRNDDGVVLFYGIRILKRIL